VENGTLVRGHAVNPGRPYYMPAGVPRLATDFAQLQDRDSEAVLRFAHRWGHLGYGELQMPNRSEPRDDAAWIREYIWAAIQVPDPLDWIWAHARGVRACLAAADFLRTAKEDTPGELPDFPSVRTFIQEPQPVLDIFDDIAFGSFGVGSRFERIQLQTTPLYPAGARAVLSWLLTRNLGGLSHRIEPSRRRLEHGYTFNVLLDMIYWHVARYALGSNAAGRPTELARCEECGALFERKHGHQRYCPPDDWELQTARERGGKAESRCSMRARARKLRERNR